MIGLLCEAPDLISGGRPLQVAERVEIRAFDPELVSTLLGIFDLGHGPLVVLALLTLQLLGGLRDDAHSTVVGDTFEDARQTLDALRYVMLGLAADVNNRRQELEVKQEGLDRLGAVAVVLALDARAVDARAILLAHRQMREQTLDAGAGWQGADRSAEQASEELFQSIIVGKSGLQSNLHVAGCCLAEVLDPQVDGALLAAPGDEVNDDGGSLTFPAVCGR